MRRLSKRDCEIVKLYFRDGWTQESIGEKFGISHQRVSNILRKPEAAKELDRAKSTARDMARARLMLNADRAAGVMLDMLESKNENQRYLAALDVMNRAKVEEAKQDATVEIVFVNGMIEIGEEEELESGAELQADAEAADIPREPGP